MTPLRTAVVLRSDETTEVRPYIGPDSSHTYYVLSPRGAGGSYGDIVRKLEPSKYREVEDPPVPVHTLPVSSYADVETRPWSKGVILGDYSLNAILGTPGGVSDLLFPFGPGKAELWMLIVHGLLSEEQIERAKVLGIPRRRLVIGGGRPSPSPVDALRFSTPEQISAFYPAGERHRPWSFTGLGMRPDAAPLFEQLEVASQTYILGGVISGDRLRNYFRQPLNLKKHWLFTLRSDVTFHDVSDPIYCIPNARRGAFEARLFEFLRREGFDLHVLPLTEPILSNWIGWGEIPVPAQSA